MNALDWATKNISFDEATSLVGKFDIEKYRMLKRPLLELDNIHTKRLTIYKASSAGGTILLQIAISFWIDQRPGGIQVAMQSDDACDDWMILRGKKWLSRIPSLANSMSNEKHAITNKRWQWPHAWLLLTGPGESAQQAKQVRFFASDESHTEAFKPGSLASFEERMGKRWQRMALHVTTAATEGKEVDKFYYSGGQNEFHLCCPKCAKMVWPLWEEDSQKEYNGHRVFQFGDYDPAPKFVCPHCLAEYHDNSRDRRALHEGSDYLCKNPNHDRENESFRWNCFGAWFMEWSGHLLKYRESIESIKLGDLKPHEDWIKKRLCQSYVPHLPNIGQGDGSNDYKLGSIWVVDNSLRVCSFDVQDADGFHLFGQVDQFTPDGNSRRIAFDKLLSWDESQAFQQHHESKDENTYCDAGHRMREVFGRCAQYKWYALFSEDTDEFANMERDPQNQNGPLIAIRRPYTKPVLEDSMSGKRNTGPNCGRVSGNIPPGFCLSRRWSKPTIGSYLMALKSGNTGRYYGIASDISPDFTAQLNSYAFAKLYNKTRGTTEVILKQIKVDDHAFATSSMCLLGAVIRGFYPLSNINNEPKLEEAAA